MAEPMLSQYVPDYLVTPGEVVEANFGQSPFLFNVDDYTQVLLTSES